jgi:nucleoside-diphosphate-sugar epimerase
MPMLPLLLDGGHPLERAKAHLHQHSLDAEPFAKVRALARDPQCDAITVRHYFVRVQDKVGKSRRVPDPHQLTCAVRPFTSASNVTLLLEMRYLWRVPLRMDNARLRAVIGAEPHTPLDEAVEATLVGLGCLRALWRPSGLSVGRIGERRRTRAHGT